jgi:hypothetical protein
MERLLQPETGLPRGSFPWIAGHVPARNRDGPNRRSPAQFPADTFLLILPSAVGLDWAGDLSLRGRARKLLQDDE